MNWEIKEQFEEIFLKHLLGATREKAVGMLFLLTK
jgi:hypothetical protein